MQQELKTNLHFNMKDLFIEIIENLTAEQLAEGIIKNEISFKILRYKAITMEYEKIRNTTNKPLNDIAIDLMEMFHVSERTVRNALSCKSARRLP